MNTSRTSIDEALYQVEDAERSLLATNLATEGEYLAFYGRYALTGLRSLDEGSCEYTKRLVFVNKKYRHDTKQALADSAQQLLRLHSSKQTGENAYQRLKSIVFATLRTCRDLYALFDQKQQDWTALLRCANEQPTIRRFNNRSIKHVESIITQVRQDEALIRQVWDEWEACFEALCMERHLLAMYAVLCERKLTKDWFVKECTPLFSRLEGIWKQRSQILKDVHGVGNTHLATWVAVMPDFVPTAQVQSQVEVHSRAEELISMSRVMQKQVMSELNDLDARARCMPATLPGPGDVEIPVERLRKTTSQYETLLGLISKTYTIAMDAQEEIKTIQMEVVVV